MTSVVLLEPHPSTAWFPFIHCRPICELRAGAWLIRERWEAVANAETSQILGAAHLSSFVEDGVPPVTTRAAVPGPALVGRSDFAPAGVAPDLLGQPLRLPRGVVIEDPVRIFLALVSMASIIRLAMMEAPALFGIVICLLAVFGEGLDDQPVYWLNLASVVLFLFYLAASFPTRERVLELLRRKQEEAGLV